MKVQTVAEVVENHVTQVYRQLKDQGCRDDEVAGALGISKPTLYKYVGKPSPKKYYTITAGEYVFWTGSAWTTSSRQARQYKYVPSKALQRARATAMENWKVRVVVHEGGSHWTMAV